MPGFMGLRGLEQRDVNDMLGQRPASDQRFDTEKHSMRRAEAIIREHHSSGDSPSGGNAGRGDVTMAGEVMSGRVAVLTFDDTVLTAHAIFSRVKFKHLPIVNEKGGIIGVVSDRDILRHSSPFLGTVNEQSRDREIMSKKVGLIMTRTPLCVFADTPITEAIKLMNGRRISCLPIVAEDGATLLGIMTWKDVVHALSPECFNSGYDIGRLRTGAKASSDTSRRRALAEDDAKLRARAAESARIKSLTMNSIKSAGEGADEEPGARDDQPRD